jgi:hypothetical protein
VDGQQEKVDILADHINDSRAYTLAGAEQIHKATHGLLQCAPLNGTCHGMSFVDDQDTEYQAFPHPHTTQVAREESARTAVHMKETFHASWSMPFGTLHDDFQAVRNDVLEFGREMIEGLSNNPNVKKLGLHCSGCEGEEYQRGVRTETYQRTTVSTPA